MHDSNTASPKIVHRKSTFHQSNAEDKKLHLPEQSQKNVTYRLPGMDSPSSSVRKDKDSPLSQCHEVMGISHQSHLQSSPRNGRRSCLPGSSESERLSSEHAHQRNKKEALPWDAETVNKVLEMQQEMHKVLNDLVVQVASVQRSQTQLRSSDTVEGVGVGFKSWVLILVLVVFQTFLQWIFFR